MDESKIKEEAVKLTINELKDIRKRITMIYMDMGNPKGLSADSVLSEEINKLENYLKSVKTKYCSKCGQQLR